MLKASDGNTNTKKEKKIVSSHDVALQENVKSKVFSNFLKRTHEKSQHKNNQ